MYKITNKGYLLHQGTQEECQMIYNAISLLCLSHKGSYIDLSQIKITPI